MPPDYVMAILVAGTVATLLTRGLIHFLTQRALLDHPNERSLHVTPPPPGGGWAILLGTAAGCMLLHQDRASLLHYVPLVAGAILLVAISWWDDMRGLLPFPRFTTQIIAVALGLTFVHGHVFQGWLPVPLDYAVTAIGWLWFMNLFNFMDGMDGLAGGEALVIACGLFLLPPHLMPLLVLAAAILGFLVWNWAPAKIFLGDIGSIPLGFVLGAFLLQGAERGYWAACLILPLYFLVDATLTLLKRLFRGETIWQAHRQHYYQQAVQNGASHARVATAVMLCNLWLVACAIMVSRDHPLAALMLAAAGIGALTGWMMRKHI